MLAIKMANAGLFVFLLIPPCLNFIPEIVKYIFGITFSIVCLGELTSYICKVGAYKPDESN